MTAGATLMLVGAFGPWIRTVFFSAAGVDAWHGWVVAGAALSCGGMMIAHGRYSSWSRLLALGAVLAAVGALITLGSLADDIYGAQIAEGDNPLFGNADLVAPGWGFIMAQVGAAAAALGGVLLWVQGRAPRRPVRAYPDAGWYPDPRGVAGVRYWDGSDWTERTAGHPKRS